VVWLGLVVVVCLRLGDWGGGVGLSSYWEKRQDQKKKAEHCIARGEERQKERKKELECVCVSGMCLYDEYAMSYI